MENKRDRMPEGVAEMDNVRNAMEQMRTPVGKVAGSKWNISSADEEPAGEAPAQETPGTNYK